MCCLIELEFWNCLHAVVRSLLIATMDGFKSGSAFPCQYHSATAPWSSYVCCYCQKDKRAKPGNLQIAVRIRKSGSIGWKSTLSFLTSGESFALAISTISVASPLARCDSFWTNPFYLHAWIMIACYQFYSALRKPWTVQSPRHFCYTRRQNVTLISTRCISLSSAWYLFYVTSFFCRFPPPVYERSGEVPDFIR
jgi:hypothetical protein